MLESIGKTIVRPLYYAKRREVLVRYVDRLDFEQRVAERCTSVEVGGRMGSRRDEQHFPVAQVLQVNVTVDFVKDVEKCSPMASCFDVAERDERCCSVNDVLPRCG